MLLSYCADPACWNVYELDLIRRSKLPGLLGMLATGVVLGPYVLNLLDSSILGISSELRKIA